MIEHKPVSVDDDRWEHEATVYRVYFWKQISFPEPPDKPMWFCDPQQILGASDVVEVLGWAEANADGRRFTVYVEVNRGTNTGLVHIYGIDPTKAE